MSNLIKFRITIFFIYNFNYNATHVTREMPGADARKNPPDPKERVKLKILRKEEVLD